MTQHLHLLTNSMLGQPTDLWVSATQKVPPQIADQISAGFVKNWNKHWTLEVEGYYKKMQQVIAYKEGANYLFGKEKQWDNKVTSGEGVSYGLETQLSLKSERFSGWLSYTISRSERQFEIISQGKAFPYKYDRTHDASLFLSYRLRKNKELGIVYHFRSGHAVTLPVGTYEMEAPPFWEKREGIEEHPFFENANWYKSRNNTRLPAYHRLDISFKTIKKKKSERHRSWIFSIYNVYNRLNTYFIYEQEGKLKSFALFPIIPSVAYRLEF
jgi:hypothetical protein